MCVFLLIYLFVFFSFFQIHTLKKRRERVRERMRERERQREQNCLARASMPHQRVLVFLHFNAICLLVSYKAIMEDMNLFQIDTIIRTSHTIDIIFHFAG